MQGFSNFITVVSGEYGKPRENTVQCQEDAPKTQIHVSTHPSVQDGRWEVESLARIPQEHNSTQKSTRYCDELRIIKYKMLFTALIDISVYIIYRLRMV